MSWARESAMRSRSRQALGSLEALVGTWRGIVVLCVLAVAVYALESVGWPAQPGRDVGVYLRYFAQMGPGDTVFPWAMLTRTPVAPIVTGGVLAAGGCFLVDVLLVAMFA